MCMDYEVEGVRPREIDQRKPCEVVENNCWTQQLNTRDARDHAEWWMIR